MANHSPYPHQGPGPSSYYQPPSSPHPSYGDHSPVPRANYYPYPAVPPPQMVAHPAPQYHQPAPTRGNHRGGHMNGSYNPRGAHHYHHSYHPQAQQPPSPYAHSPVSSPLHPPHPQHAQHMPYSPQYTKYVQPYSPAYHYPSPTAPVFTPSWQTQQPLSPLPKQLSVPPPNPQNFYDPPRNSRSQTASVAHSPSPAEPAPIEEESVTAEDNRPPLITAILEPEAQPKALHEDDVPPSEASVLSEDVPEPEVAEEPSVIIPPSSKIYLQMGTIDASEFSAPPSSSSSKSNNNNSPQWTIWSRRPQDPSHAPSIIISPRAQPPPDVVQQALELKTPPPSPRAPPTVKLPIQTPNRAILEASPDTFISSQNSSTVPSSSVTESTNTPTVPGSPVSSHTSVSISGTPAKEGINGHAAAPTPGASSSPTPDVAPSDGAKTPSKLVEEQTETSAVPSTTEATTPDPSSSNISTSPTPTSAPVASPPPATPAPSGPAPPKKSWASLLRPANASSTSTSSTPGPSRNALPTSAVVGFSIPAVASPSNPAVPVNPSQKSELLNLLSSGPAPPSTGFAAAAASASTSASAIKIRPRGLVNSGNMCFANAVLQILVYCPPFHKLFVELNRLLVGPVVGGNNSKDETTKSASGSTPLVDATATFLQEFLEDKDKKKGSSSRKLEVVGARGSVNGAGGSGNGPRSGKGKEKEVKEDGPDHDDWDGESFLPSYVYEAMKTKKIFDTMRGGHQEDAEEFLGFYLDTLEDELLSLLHSINPPAKDNGDADVAVEEREETAPPEDDGWLEVGKRNRTVVTRTIKATESPITRIFGGKFRSTLRAPSQKDSVIVEDWRSLRLDIQRDQIHSIQDALSYISHPQPVQVNPKPGVTIEAQQQMLIEALPPILILHVKRFLYDTSVNGVVKVSKHVRFGPELEIGSDVVVPAAKKTQPARYKLFGAVYHHGLSAAGGHYTLDVLHPNRYPSSNPAARPVEGWVRIDDEFVSDVRPEDVFKAPERDDTRCAYLLFYRRV